MGRSPSYLTNGDGPLLAVDPESARRAIAAVDVFVEHGDGRGKHWSVAGRLLLASRESWRPS